MATLGDIVFDAAHPASLARFWAAALDGYAVAPYDDEELARLRANGINDPEDDPSVLVEPAVPGAPRLFFTRVPEPKTVKNRVHLDLRAADVDEETARLVKLGATELARLEGWVTLADPEGNELDVLPMR
jgi:Glyoxalase-like domain